jgi:hypothetical protein
MSGVSGYPLKIQESDLRGDCSRLNRRLNLIQDLASGQIAPPQAPPVSPIPFPPPIFPGASTNIQEINLTAPSTFIASPSVTSGIFVLIITQDATGGRAVVFSPIYVGGVTLAGMLSTIALTYSALTFIIRGDGRLALTGIVTGVPAA